MIPYEFDQLLRAFRLLASGNEDEEEGLRAARETMEFASCEDCRAWLLGTFRTLGIEVHVSNLPPILRSKYPQPFSIKCPHGRAWYAEPTSEQIMQWAKDGTP